MTSVINRRQFLQLAGLGSIGVVFGSALPGMARAAGQDDFYFVQLSDTHWGFEGPPNPDAKGTLKKAVAAVNALDEQPDFIVFTGDLTHTTDNPVERRKRAGGVQGDRRRPQASRTVRFMPGEHDASLDSGKAFQEFFGATHYTFDHKGVHFIALDNVSDPRRADRRRAARLAGGGPQAAAGRGADRRAHASAAVRPLSAVGLGDARRRARRSSC